jgi:glutaminyl-tRNA synthetase
MVDIAMLEHCLREDLNKRAQRVMAVIDPVKVIVDNYPEGKTEYVEAVNNPEDESMGKREMPFSANSTLKGQTSWKSPRKVFSGLLPERKSVSNMPII